MASLAARITTDPASVLALCFTALTEMLCCSLASMMPLRKSAGITLRIIAALSCCLGIWNLLKLTRADWYFRKDTAQSIQKAIGLVPDGWPYYMRLAQFQRANARDLLTTSLRLNPYDAQANIELGLEYEAEGDLSRAQQQLLQAYNIDHTYLPRWTLANYYFRHGNMQEFWVWSRNAAAMPADDIGALLDLAWRATPDPQTITAALLNEKPEFLRQYVNFLISKNQPVPAAMVARRLMTSGNVEEDLPVLLTVVNRLISANEAAPADALCRFLVSQ